MFKRIIKRQAVRIKNLYGDKIQMSKIFLDKKDPDGLTDDEFNKYVAPQLKVLSK
jgi:hypothetical protein